MDLFEEIREILVELLDVEAEEIAAGSYLVRDLGLESIDFLELAVALNTRFKVPVVDDVVFLRNLRLYVTQSKELSLAPLMCLSEQYGFLSQARLVEILSDIENGPVIQVQDLMGYVQWQMTSSKAA